MAAVLEACVRRGAARGCGCGCECRWAGEEVWVGWSGVAEVERMRKGVRRACSFICLRDSRASLTVAERRTCK